MIRGGGISWKSDNEMWATIASYLAIAEIRLGLAKDATKDFLRHIRNMSWFEFRKLKAQIKDADKLDEALFALIPEWDYSVPRDIKNPYREDEDEDEVEKEEVEETEKNR